MPVPTRRFFIPIGIIQKKVDLLHIHPIISVEIIGHDMAYTSITVPPAGFQRHTDRVERTYTGLAVSQSQPSEESR